MTQSNNTDPVVPQWKLLDVGFLIIENADHIWWNADVDVEKFCT